MTDVLMESYVFDRTYMVFFLKVSPEIWGLSHCVKVRGVVVSRGQCFYCIESLTSVMKLIVTAGGGGGVTVSISGRDFFFLIMFALALPAILLSNDYDVRAETHPLSFNSSGASESMEFVVYFTWLLRRMNRC
jgi:hypothetical protein